MSHLNIRVNEVFGPTVQGEGLEIGQPAIFVRLHSCPVQCPGCDTAYTWNGTEEGTPEHIIDELGLRLYGLFADNPKCGLVLTGGEPVIHFQNTELRRMLLRTPAAWRSLETSGYFIGRDIIDDTVKLDHLAEFLETFNSVHLSPKITPCLHGIHSDERLLVNERHFRVLLSESPTKLAYKFVVKDDKDVDAVLRFIDMRPSLKDGWYPIYLMPYGNDRDEILHICDWMMPVAAKYGFRLSPRLHSLMWGAKRGV